jgi:sulfur carrier protein ThiS
MNATLRPIGLLKLYCQRLVDDEGRIDLTGREGQTLERIILEIGLPRGMVSLFIVNGHSQTGSYRVESGDDVKFVAVIGGG